MDLFRVKGLAADLNPDIEYQLDCNVVRPIASQSDKYEDNEPETSEQLVTYYAFESTTASGSSKKITFRALQKKRMLTNVMTVLLIDPTTATSDTAVRKVALSEGSPEDFKEHAQCVSFPCPAIPPLSQPIEAMSSSDRRKSNDPVAMQPSVDSDALLLTLINGSRT